MLLARGSGKLLLTPAPNEAANAMESMNLRVFTKRIAEDESFRRKVANSLSPGAAGGLLGVSRQRVHAMLRSGVLDGCRVTSDDGPAIVLVYEGAVETRRLRKVG